MTLPRDDGVAVLDGAAPVVAVTLVDSLSLLLRFFFVLCCHFGRSNQTEVRPALTGGTSHGPESEKTSIPVMAAGKQHKTQTLRNTKRTDVVQFQKS